MTDEHFWKAQTPETRRILTEAMKETTEWNETYAEQMNKREAGRNQKNSAIHIYELSDKEKQEWMKRLDPVYRQYEPIFGRELIRELLELRKDS